MEHAIGYGFPSVGPTKYKRVPTDVDTRPLPCGSFVRVIGLFYPAMEFQQDRENRTLTLRANNQLRPTTTTSVVLSLAVSRTILSGIDGPGSP